MTWPNILNHKNTILITPNRRLAASLRAKYNHLQQDTHTTWESPLILPYETWLQDTFVQLASQHYLPQKQLLTPSQLTHLWENIITDACAEKPFLNTKDTAKLALGAYDTCLRWQLNPQDASFAQHENAKTFASWAKDFQALCQKNHYSTLHTLADELIKHIDLLAKNPQTFYWIGFTEFSPQQNALIKHLKHRGIAQHILNTLNPHDAKVYLAKQTTPDIEHEAMAYFAKENALQGKTVACIIPELEQDRAEIEAVFSRVCGHDINVNISAGIALAKQPIIHAALSILQLNQHHIPIETLSQLCRSPFIAGGETTSRALLAAKLYEWNKPQLSARDFLFYTKKQSTCPQLSKNLSDFIALQKPAKQSPEKWAHLFQQKLKAMGFPGDRSPNSLEYQALERWRILWDEFTDTDPEHRDINCQTALKRLRNAAHACLFQGKAPDHCPIHVLGLLEAAGLEFDAVWILGLNDQSFPTTPKPNPFIPFSLQRTLKMPHSDAQKEWDFAKKLLQQFIQANDTVIMSYAERDGDQVFKPSPLTAAYPPYTYNAPEKTQSHPTTLDTLRDEQAPSIQEPQTIKGGSTLFKLQALCPFRAFSELRLQAKPIPHIETGITAIDRGIIAHRVLELLWETLKTQERLLQSSESDMQDLLTCYIESALTETLPNYYLKANKRLMALEKKRLDTLLKDWLAIEKERPDFTVIACEEKQTIECEGITLSLRIDRIDQLHDGSHLIIDYKTGKTTVTSWLNKRLTEPQLPLYCINHEKTNSIAFASLHKEALGMKGIHKETDDDSSYTSKTYAIKPIEKYKTYTEYTDWSSQKIAWKNQLQGLARDFKTGNAMIDPTQNACGTCHLHNLCRITDISENA